MYQGKVLIIDDEAPIRELITQLLALENYEVFSSGTVGDGLKILSNEDIQVLILDIKLPDGNGLEILPEIRNKYPLTEIIMLTAFGKIADGVSAIKNGAFDYITKGDDDEKIIPLVKKAIEKNQLAQRINNLEGKISNRYGIHNIIGESSKIKDAVNLAVKVSQSDSPVLLYGPTGTGKEIFAEAIHFEGKRKGNPFVVVNCCAIQKDLLESELFGYKAGAFTGAIKNKKGLFEEAHEGTLFLDEIGDMDIALQAKLLRAIETNSFIKAGDTKNTKVDVRIITATNKDLQKAVENGEFRSDLYYRISVFNINLPALKDRKEDIPLLVNYFINHYAEKQKKYKLKVEDSFYEAVKNYNFPGNIRELRNIIERVVLLAEDGLINASLLPSEFFLTNIENVSDFSMDDLEKKHIIKVLRMTKNNKPEAAKILNIGLTTLYRKIEQYQIET